MLQSTLLRHALIFFFSAISLNSVAQGKYSLGLSPINRMLTQSTILSVIKSGDGVLWIATLDGISRYDGSEILDFRPYKTEIGFLESANLINLIEDKEGNIYAATKDAGLLIYDRSTESFKPYFCCEFGGIPDTEISTSYSDDTGRIWLGLSTGSVISINPRLRATTFFEGASKSKIVDFSQDSNGQVLAGSSNGDLITFDLSKNEALYFKLPGHCRSQIESLRRIAVAENSNVWIGTKDNGLHLVNLEKDKCQKIWLEGVDSTRVKKVPIHRILYDKRNKSTLVATDQGLYAISSELNIHHFHVANSILADNAVVSLANDNDDMYWIGTFSGLNHLTPTEIESYGVKHDSALHSIVAIDSSNKGDILIASYNGLLFYDPAQHQHHELSTYSPQQNFTNRQIMSLNIDDKGTWVGYRSTGLEFYSVKDDQVMTFSTQSRIKITSDSISTILTAYSGETIIGTHGGGVNILSRDLAQVFHILENKKVIMLYQTSDGLIWIGTESGLYQLTLSSRVIEKLDIELLLEASATSPIIWAMAEAEDGDLWFGTMHHGLYILRKKTREFDKVSLENTMLHSGASASSIYAIETDDDGNIWSSTNRGIVRIDPVKNSVLNISSHHGLISTEFDLGVSHKDPLGFLYFGGSDGYIRFDPKKVKKLDSVPTIRLAKIQLANNSLRSTDSILQAARPLELTHKNHYVTFTFSVLDFIDPDKNQFRYKLEGFDPDWIENGTRNTATYTNLPPGQYVLRVQGANSSGIWNREGLSLDFLVLPPPWLTWWAYTLYVLVALFIFWMGKRAYDSYSIERRAVQLAKEKYDAENRADDDMQEQLEVHDELVRSAYDHNVATLSLISNFISHQSDYAPEGEPRDAIENNVKRISCLSLLESCLYFQNEGLLADLHKYGNLITSRLLEDATVRQESIITINDIPKKLIPAEIASPLSIVIYELLANCMKHAFESESPANYIQLSIENLPGDNGGPNGYRLKISDNGIGMPQSLQSNTQETTGLAIVQSITNKLFGTLQISSDKGTTVTLDIPPPRESAEGSFNSAVIRDRNA